MKSKKQIKGSILIWSLMLGFLLTSVFFFVIMRQRTNTAVQRDTISIMNKKAYLESYADYIEGLNATSLATITSSINFDGITGTVKNEVSAITGIVDFDKSVDYKQDTNNTIFVEWNKCDADMKADLYFNKILYTSSGNPCTDGYKDMAGPIEVTAGTKYPLTTANAPFYYRITSQKNILLKDGKWHMDLSIDLGNGKKENIKKSFKPKS